MMMMMFVILFAILMTLLTIVVDIAREHRAWYRADAEARRIGQRP